jgi:hypothetical protein
LSLTRELISEDECEDSLVIAQTRSQSQGRFELTALEADVKKALADPPAIFEIWIHKAGLALGHRFIFGEPSQEPQILSMRKESPTTICVHKPDGSLCNDARIAPTYVWLPVGHWSRLVPKPIQDQLKTRSMTDARVTVAGRTDQLAIVAIETTQFGEQQVVIPPQQDPPTAVTLRETRTVEGRLVLRDGEKVDLSKLTVRIREVSAERGPDAKVTQGREQGVAPPLGTRYARFIVRPDHDGRFSIAKFPKFEHGHLAIQVGGPDEIPFSNDPNDCMVSFKGPPDRPAKIDIPVRRGCWVTRIVRDARTKRPLPGIDIKMISSKDASLQDESDENGRFRVCLCPGARYHVQCRLPDGYLRAVPGCEDDVVVPPGVEQLELKPIELVSASSIEGEVADTSGKPLAGVRVLARYREDDGEAGLSQGRDVSRWATTDSAGKLGFEGIATLTVVALAPIRDGIPLSGPLEIATAGIVSVPLREKPLERVALSGGILGTDHKPIPGAQVVVEVEHSLDPTRTFRTTVDSHGSFQTPPHFPKQLKYRVTVRAILKDIASSAWICPATSGSQFADLVVERSKLGLDSRFFGKEVVTLVDGRPILASELLERAYPEPLPPDGLSLLVAAKGLQNDRVTEAEYRALQETAIRKYALDYAATRMLSRAYETRFDQEWKEKTEQAISKMFEEYVEKLKKDLKTSDRDELDRKLHRQGTSLASLKVEYRYRLLADEYLRQALPSASDLDWQRVLAYYQAHRQKYAVREKVTWQLLEIGFDDLSSRPPISGQQAEAYSTDSGSQTAQTNHSQDLADRLDLGSFDPKRDQNGTSLEKRPEAEVVTATSESTSNLGREKAQQTLQKAIACEWMGLPFEKIVKKFSTGPNADQGSWQPRVRPVSVADAKTSAALRQLSEGATSGVIETEHSFRIIRVACRTAAGYQPFEEVEQSIREHIRYELQTKALEELYSRTAIESPYIDDALVVLQPPRCSVPARSQTDAFAP